MTEIRWSDEIVMISGGSSGMGLATARRLGKKGARISLCARHEEPLLQAEESLRGEGIEVMAVPADVSSEDEVNRWFNETEARWGHATILFNNAGIEGKGPLLELTEEKWVYVIGVNCRGPYLCSRRALLAMIAAKKGRIIFNSSMASQYFHGVNSLYFASKWALNAFAHCLAKEVREHNIHVNIVCPGMTDTEFFEPLGGRPHSQDMRYLTPNEIAEIVERFCTLPEDLDMSELCIFPSWQLPNFGVRK